MTNDPIWKQRLYDCYVSSGQAGDRTLQRHSREGRASALAPASAARFVARHIPTDRNTRIVDLGCGQAAVLQSLQQSGYRNIWGVDASAEQIAIAHRFGLPAEHGTIESYLSKAKDSSVGVILMIDILEHMSTEELFRVLDAVIRALTTGGKCIAHVPNGEGLYGMRIRYGDLTHEQAFTTQSASQMFSAVGFTTVRCHEDRPIVHGAVSLARRVIWDLGTLPHRLLLAAETGLLRGPILTQNMFVEAIK